MKRQFIIFWTAIILAVYGLITDMFVNFRNYLILVLVIGVLFLLYKFLPKRQPQQSKPKIIPSKKTMEKVASTARKSTTGPIAKKHKNYPFQVIEGQKGKNDDQTPKYH
ncbi:hypothetical protein J2T13_003078 [Paenibacillus sp. DS2015]|uniref:hypothetical protein n=1 Tax=Paenibacillus sp. DS2015 TaxID=3373917 RepID=UPI003D1E80F2